MSHTRRLLRSMSVVSVATIMGVGCGSGDSDDGSPEASAPLGDGSDTDVETEPESEPETEIDTAGDQNSEGVADQEPLDQIERESVPQADDSGVVFVPAGISAIDFTLPDGRTENYRARCSMYQDGYEKTTQWGDLTGQEWSFYYREDENGEPTHLTFNLNDADAGAITAGTPDLVSEAVFDGTAFTLTMNALQGPDLAPYQVTLSGDCS